jgi:hypothetical protein
VTGRGLVGHRLATAQVKALRLCYQLITEADLLEAATTRIFTVDSVEVQLEDSPGKR